MTFKRVLCRVVICCGAFGVSGQVNLVAQVRGLNLLEFQVGNTPYSDPAGMATVFNQLNLGMASRGFEASLRVEQFLSPNSRRDYQRLSQYRLTYKYGGAELTGGHFYDILGRGLLLRAFEIPGVVFEDPASRVRQGFYRDIYGFRARYASQHYSIKALRGKPLVNVLPPTISSDERRADLIEALEVGVSVGGSSFGSAVLRNTIGGEHLQFGTVNVSSQLPMDLAGYAEFAQQLGDGTQLFDLSDDSRFALYANLSVSKTAFGATLEFKHYNNFFLGAGYNDPPSLIKEHPYAVLNRSTHILNVVNERGAQLEAFFRTPQGQVITANVTRAVNDFNKSYAFQEYFVEVVLPIDDVTAAKVFADFATDEFRFEDNRISAGGYVERLLPDRWSVSVDIEGQVFTRTLGDAESPTNFVLGLTVSKSTRYTLGVVAERSTDPFLTDNPRTAEIELEPRYWLGCTAGFRPSRNHSIAVFAGTRRGGPACASGICYEVLDFVGADVRLTTRF